MKKKINKVKVSIVIIGLLLIISISIFGRYIYNNNAKNALQSREFYFTSNLLDIKDTQGKAKEYTYLNWTGEQYDINVELYSYKNLESILDYDINYSISVETKDSGVNMSIGSSNTNKLDGVIYSSKNSNTENVTIHVNPTKTFKMGDSITLTITAKSTAPYEKEIYATINLKVGSSLTSDEYSIKDKANQAYATLKLTNIQDTSKEIQLVFDPKIVRLDLGSEIYKNNTLLETQSIDGITYVNKIKFIMGSKSSKSIKFYKVDPTKDYTFSPSIGTQTQTSVITVTKE